MMFKLFFWNIWLKIAFLYKIKFKKKDIQYYIRRTHVKEGWSLTFQDEFEQGLNRDIWRTDAYYGMRFHPGNIIDKDEAPNEYLSDDYFELNSTVIKLKAAKHTHKVTYQGNAYAIPYTVGQIDSSNYFMQTYGYFEIRSKMPNSTGMWPAFYLASIMSWPPEIDIYEIYTGRKNGKNTITNNIQGGSSNKIKMKPAKIKAIDLSKNYFIYGCEWSKETIKFYFQDELIRVVKTPVDFIHPMHIIINTAVDVDNVEGAEFPNYHEIDYVRAYTRKDI